MHILFEDSGKILGGRIVSQVDASAQVELNTGKRVKVKTAHVLLSFEKPDATALLEKAQTLAQTIDLDLAWEFAADDEFSFVNLAKEYFSAQATTEEQTATLLALQQAPHYFRRLGKGHFKKASADVLKQALAAIEKKKQQQAQIDTWAHSLAEGHCAPAIVQQLYKILFKPDKNTPEYKAVVQAAKTAQLSPLTLLQNAKAIGSAYEFHWQRFLFENFPSGTEFGTLPALNWHSSDLENLPPSPVQAFSIDDSMTTEIDDALSVQGLGTGEVTLGIHIAAPSLAFSNNDAFGQLAASRLSTVYMPGHKITMLPAALVEQFTLKEGQYCPAVSLYVTYDEETLSIKSSKSKIERVQIVHNLRYDQLDAIVTDAWLQGETAHLAQHTPAQLLQNHAALQFLFRLAQHLKAQREKVRGKPEVFNRPDYVFKVLDETGQAIAKEPTGSERVQIQARKRGAPLDLIVAECMIVANSTWGKWLADLGVPAIYRSQASLAPGVKVRMNTKALPHAGIGVPCYAWSTSPLRRYTDLVNQWQIVACIQNGSTAALAAPFKPKDAQLFAIISAFESAYSAYNTHQSTMERYWTLRYLEQNNLKQATASAINAQMVRVNDLPLVLTFSNGLALPKGAQVLVSIGKIDFIALQADARVEKMLEQDPLQESMDESLETQEELAVGLQLAIDVEDADAQTVPLNTNN